MDAYTPWCITKLYFFCVYIFKSGPRRSRQRGSSAKPHDPCIPCRFFKFNYSFHTYSPISESFNLTCRQNITYLVMICQSWSPWLLHPLTCYFSLQLMSIFESTTKYQKLPKYYKKNVQMFKVFLIFGLMREITLAFFVYR